MTFHHGPCPDFLAGIGVAGVEPAHHTELITRGAVHQQHLAGFLILDDEGRARHGVAHLVVAKLLIPDDFAGGSVQGHDAGIQSAEIDFVAIDGRATVDHVAAGADVFGQAVLIGPQTLAGAGIQRHKARVGGGDVDHAVVDQRLGFLATLFFTAERIAPCRQQVGHVLGVHALERAVTLCRKAQAIGEHVIRGLVVVGNVFPRHRLYSQCGQGNSGGQRKTQCVQAQRTVGRTFH